MTLCSMPNDVGGSVRQSAGATGEGMLSQYVRVIKIIDSLRFKVIDGMSST